MISDRTFLFHISISWGKTLSLVKVKVICQAQGQISSSQFLKKRAVAGSFLFHKHILFCNIFYPLRDSSCHLSHIYFVVFNSFNLSFGNPFQNFRLFKFKTSSNKKVKSGTKELKLSERVENKVGKGENGANQHFLLFPQCFQEVSL